MLTAAATNSNLGSYGPIARRSSDMRARYRAGKVDCRVFFVKTCFHDSLPAFRSTEGALLEAILKAAGMQVWGTPRTRTLEAPPWHLVHETRSPQLKARDYAHNPARGGDQPPLDRRWQKRPAAPPIKGRKRNSRANLETNMPNKLQRQIDPDLAAMTTLSKLLLERAVEAKQRRTSGKDVPSAAETDARIRKEADRYLIEFTAQLQATLDGEDPARASTALARSREAKRAEQQKRAARRAKLDARIARNDERIRKRHRRVKALQIALAAQRIDWRGRGRRRPTSGRRVAARGTVT